MDEQRKAMRLGKSWCAFQPMFRQATRHVVGHSNVQHAVASVRKDVDEALLHGDSGQTASVTVPGLQRIIPLRSMLRCARDTAS